VYPLQQLRQNNMASTERFAFAWKKFSKIIPEYETQFLGWVHPLVAISFKNKIVLDAGCGIGRNSFWPLKYGAKKLVAFDYDRGTVAIAQKNVSRFNNAKITYQSIYEITYRNQFDIAFSIGVIHHLENPELAVKNLVAATKRGGKILIWVYGQQKNKVLLKLINLLRVVTSKMPLFLTFAFALFLTIPLFVYVRIVPQRQIYFQQLSHFRFWHIHSIVFDQLLPKVAHYWTKEEAVNLFAGLDVKNIRAYPVNGISWTIIAQKK
jgi:SAM-dependent methyltransferase